MSAQWGKGEPGMGWRWSGASPWAEVGVAWGGRVGRGGGDGCVRACWTPHADFLKRARLRQDGRRAAREKKETVR